MKNLNQLALNGEINENASIKDSHSIIINAEIKKVWEILSDIEAWPLWNPDIKKINLDGKLSSGTRFEWTQGRTKGVSEIQVCKEPSTLSWTSKAKMVKRIYVWNLESDDNQTIATLSASFQGFMVILAVNHQTAYDELIGWLERLKNRSEE